MQHKSFVLRKLGYQPISHLALTLLTIFLLISIAGGGGVAMYVSKTLLSRQLLIDDHIEHKYKICAVAVEDQRHRTLIVTIYRPPNSSFSDTVNFYNVVYKLCVGYNKIIIVGDFNSPTYSQNVMKKVKRLPAFLANSYIKLQTDSCFFICGC